jgi:hypothetical protein
MPPDRNKEPKPAQLLAAGFDVLRMAKADCDLELAGQGPGEEDAPAAILRFVDRHARDLR